MVSSDKSAVHNVSSDKLHQRLSSHSDITVSQEIHDNKICSSKPEVARSIPPVAADKEVQDSDATAYALQSDLEGSTCSLPLEKTLQSPNTFPCRLQSGHDSPPLKHEKVSKDIVAEKEVLDSDATVCALQSDQERNTSSLPLEKPLQNPNTVPKLQYCQDSPSIIREKVSKDGYNWRKYGQKHVRGNEFIRNYYKCTHPNCHAKKQLEQSNSGQITDTICIGQHNHPQVNTPLPVDCVVTAVKERPDKPSSANLEDQASIEHGCVPQQTKPLDALPISTVSASHEVKAAYLQSTIIRDEVLTNESPESKRLKKDNSNADVTGIEKLTSESRVVVQTSSEVDFVNDGYRWRKYGQKLVKGNPNPRSYYRCSNPGCPVKKHVERASHDQKIVITTYEGHHDHESPSGRTVTHNGAANTPTTNINGKSGTKSRVNTVCAHTGENTCMDSKDRLNGEKTGESKSGDRVEVNVITPSSGIPESTSSEQEQNSNPGTKKDCVSLEIICHSDSALPCILNEQLKDEVRTTSEESKDECLNVATVHDTRHPENK